MGIINGRPAIPEMTAAERAAADRARTAAAAYTALTGALSMSSDASQRAGFENRAAALGGYLGLDEQQINQAMS